MMIRLSLVILLTVSTGFFAVFYRNVHGVNYKPLEVLLFSYPSFAYMLGILSLARLFYIHNSNPNTRSFIIPVFIGSALYEIQQFWGAGFFDVNDLLGLIMGLLAFMLVDYNYQTKTRDPDEIC